MKIITWCAFSFPVLLVGCTTEPKQVALPPEAPIVVQPPAISQTEQLLKQFEGARKLEAREIVTRRENARNQFQRDKSDFNRIKYALMLILPVASASSSGASTAQDDAETISVLDPLVAVGNPAFEIHSEVRALALLIHGLATERRRIREQLRDAQARLGLAKKDDARDAEVRALRARVDELETKLDALKTIDRSVNRRAAPSPK